ncbi:hypothetical protein KSC_110490 [Ktedonobacter sp. SOSP1-52]|uniref:GtrA family protein n=1 Tax=Ktedonobacter sp. SOSP1-52 TaxID=2778366 RepID=UPI00191655FC|nr:GtrA family protein [Ktedonobacter sp. SOSP1-52]GHO72157.1 hypothetical protein KSC_110490 [Ktedonobacter sp. SOSP1-52]
MSFIPQKTRLRAKYMLVLLFSEQVRPLRFLFTGGACGMLQLGLLALLAELNIEPILANILALLLAAQVNFALSSVFTWNDRPSIRTARKTRCRRWLRFHGSIAGTALFNQGIFIIARALLPILLASGLGIGMAAVANFVLGEFLVFRRERPHSSSSIFQEERNGKDR